MSSEINRFGLSRDIPSHVKRQVRKECGFGCVSCGLAIACYEHINPEFKDATEHDPKKIAFLCGACHDKVTRGVWSKTKIAALRLNPWCIANSKCHDSFDVNESDPVIWVGPNRIRKVSRILKVDDDVLLAINPAKELGEPFSISGKFYDEGGNLIFQIDENEWIGSLQNWDIESVGRTTTFRYAPSKVALKITAMPPDGIAIEKLDMTYKHTRFMVNSYMARVMTINGGGVILGGRDIQGFDPHAGLLVALADGTWKVGDGEGEFMIGPPPTDVPPFVRNRPIIKPNRPCFCGSGRAFRKCHGKS